MSEDKKKSNELMEFLDEKKPKGGASAEPPIAQNVWRVLITDDEQDVHSATTFALRNTKILGRRLEFLHASSAKETIDILQSHTDIAVIILDVVMETPNAGLDLVAVIREELGITDSRIILRTGQPNQAPEIEVIRDYDINDYKLKSELTQTKLYAALTTAVRSYKQIRLIEAGKKSLSMIVRSSAELLSREGLHEFAQGVILHLAGLLSVAPEGLICVRRESDKAGGGLSQIIAAAGHYCNLIDHPLADLDESDARVLLTRSLDNKCNVFDQHGVALYLGSDARGDMSGYVASTLPIDDLDAGLLELFCSNISICADNLSLLEKLSSYAFQDQLVMLPNRIALTERIDELLAENGADNFVLALIDIDNFAEINASLGQTYGDNLLVAVAGRLRKMFDDSVMVARIASDAFALLGPGTVLTDASILEVFDEAFNIGGEEQLLTATGGTIALSDTSICGSEAIKDASIALKSAKNNSRGEVIKFNRDMVVDAKVRLDLLRSVRNAFEMNRLYLNYQPKLCLKTGTVTGVEALIRWKNDDGDIIPPEQFIPLAEKSGLIIKMGEWVIRTALLTLSKLEREGFTGLDMAVNISVAQFRHSDLLSLLDSAIKDAGVLPSKVDLEITESIAMNDLAGNIATLNAIKGMGFKLSVDDFGTGFSSLSYLQKLPIDRLKIDRAFVHTSHTESGKEIAEMIVHLGRTLNLTVIAEGIETEEQKSIMQALGCDEAQGFLMANPMGETELFSWLAARK